jgi:hypothetical protein
MTLVVPNEGEGKLLDLWLNRSLTLKLYSNDITPGETNTAATYTEVAGGGYADLDMVGANWVITEGSPSDGEYPSHDFEFTGPTDAPSVIYGYYVIDGDGTLCWAERFEESVVPFTPTTGTVIRITPLIRAS